MSRGLWLAVVALLGARASRADTIEDKKELRDNEQRFIASLAKTNAACGTKLVASYDLASEPKERPNNFGRGSGFGYCATILDGIAFACSDPDAKPVVVEKIKTMKCSYSEGSTKRVKDRYGPELSAKGGTLTALFDWDTGNIEVETKNWIVKNL